VLPTVRSPGPVFLGFAAEAFRASQELAEGPLLPAERWRPTEARISALSYAHAALEAHTVGVHHCFFGQKMATREVVAWRQQSLVQRFAELLPKTAQSGRRQRLLRDVVELLALCRQPPPLHVVEQIELFARKDKPSGADFWFGRSTWVRRELPKGSLGDKEPGHPAGLPKDPLALGESPTMTALLVLLEHVILLDRYYPRWSEWPLRTWRRAEELSAAGWFEELRGGYDGPHASSFRRVVLG
jgi:hypothetical protein